MGYLDPDFFLGGAMSLDVERAKGVIQEKIGRPLGLDLMQAAWGIHRLANESMASAARIHAIERGKDVTRMPVFAFGGAGPVHAQGVAGILRSKRVIYPLGAGVASAIGFLTAPLSLDYIRTRPGPLAGLDWEEVNRVIGEMEAEGKKALSRTIAADQVTCRRFAEMHYRKQGYEIRVPIPTGELGPESAPRIQANFEAVYKELYGHIMPDSPIDAVSWRVIAQGPRPRLILPSAPPGGGGLEVALKGRREIYLPADRAYAPVPVYDRYALSAGQSFEGPAVIEERESTVVINRPALIKVDAASNLIADLEPGGGE